MSAARFLPSRDRIATETKPLAPVPKTLDRPHDRLLGWLATGRRRRDHTVERGVRISDRAQHWGQISSTQLSERLSGASTSLRRLPASAFPAPEDLDEILALLAEAARRGVHLRPHPEQLMAAAALAEGTLAEMATGEGKTLAIAIAAVLLAWRGRPVHVITANDYLVERDATWASPFYELCGLRSGFVTSGMTAAERRHHYSAEIAYATSKEVTADFLRDRLALGSLSHPGRRLVRSVLGRKAPACVQRGLHAAIIDEADHILIDEAVTPLIISRQSPNEDLVEACRTADTLAGTLIPEIHYRTNLRYKDIDLLDEGRRQIELETSRLHGIWRNSRRRDELVLTALKAREFFRPGEQYIIGGDDRLVIVDEFTGRAMPNRTWKQGLHQAIEAKEGLPPTIPTETLARLSFQRFFRLYRHLSGISGTGRESRGECWLLYRMPFLRVPTHRPGRRDRLPDLVFASASAKWDAVVADIVARHDRGQPILAGTRNVAASELLAARLSEIGLAHTLLNAVQHRHEASIIAEAGLPGRITIATNMAGRGTDIRLNRDSEANGGLHVIVTEPHASRRIDRQLIGRCARQSEPGSARLFASMEDDVVLRFVPTLARHLASLSLRAGFPGATFFARQLVRSAQRRSDAFSYLQRRQVALQDEKLDESLAFAGADLHLERH